MNKYIFNQKIQNFDAMLDNSLTENKPRKPLKTKRSILKGNDTKYFSLHRPNLNLSKQKKKYYTFYKKFTQR